MNVRTALTTIKVLQTLDLAFEELDDETRERIVEACFYLDTNYSLAEQYLILDAYEMHPLMTLLEKSCYKNSEKRKYNIKDGNENEFISSR